MTAAAKTLLIILLALCISNCSRKEKPAPIKDQSPYQQSKKQQIKITSRNRPKQHRVEKGETLYSIGFQYQIDYKTLAKINQINSPYRIYPGQSLKLNQPPTDRRQQSLAQTNTKVTTQAIRIEPSISATETTPSPQTTTQTEQAPIRPKKTKQPIAKQPVVTQPNAKQPTTKQPAVTQPAAKQPTTKQPTVTQPAAKQPTNKTKNKKPLFKRGKLNWLWPTKGKIRSTFKANDPSRQGLSIKGKEGQAVKASESGTVVYSGNGLLGYGELIIIKHNEQYLSAYGHNKKRLVQEGQGVSRGQKIALLGSSGTNVDNLHFEIRKNSKPINPLPLIKK